LVGQKRPLKLKKIWAIRIHLQLDKRIRELALFNLAIDSKLRGCDLVELHVRDIAQGNQIVSRAIIMQRKTHSIEDHHHLSSGPMRVLFEALRKEVLALDPCVNEEFLKPYVAYKAETNFVDVMPQAKKLRLSLNMAFHEIDDSKGLCVNITDLGH